MSESFYDILGVNEKATKEEIKKAYRSLQMKFHPDRNPNNNDAMIMTQKINEAYESLGDDERRNQYDMTRNNSNPFTRMNSHFGGPRNEDLGDIFNMFFSGGMPGMPGMHGMPGMPGMQGMPPGFNVHIFHGGPMSFQQAISKPQPIVKTININMDQVLSGTTISLDIDRWTIINGIRVNENETVSIPIPPGIDENEMIILRDKGNILNEHIKGDVKVFIKIINDTEFTRSGLDLTLIKKITLKEALCGFTFEIKYLNGKSYTLNNNNGNIIPPEYKKIYPNMGLLKGEQKGNMIIHFQVEFPEKLTTEQIEKLSEVL